MKSQRRKKQGAEQSDFLATLFRTNGEPKSLVNGEK